MPTSNAPTTAPATAYASAPSPAPSPSPLYDEIVSRRRATPIFDQVASAHVGRHSVALPSATAVTHSELRRRRPEPTGRPGRRQQRA
ncbi:hypothetical protein ACPEEZ_00160 [Frigoribacterium sp. 2-23]|uniref:hypothetical protein n=1 Tax=Frigoribacterium sp. 2-23 TaxID=3415006 RepID=UPI003C6F1526